MKKLAFFLATLISLTVIVGCNNTQKKVTRFTTNEEGEVEVTEDNGPKTTVTQLENESEEVVAMEPIEIPVNDSDEKIEFRVVTPGKKVVETDRGYHLIQGVTPKNTAKIMVNNYQISKYKAGTTDWSYIAAVSLGTLRKGENHYSVRAFDDDGKVIGSESFTIFYKGIDNGSLVDTGAPLMAPLLITLLGALGVGSIRRRK